MNYLHKLRVLKFILLFVGLFGSLSSVAQTVKLSSQTYASSPLIENYDPATSSAANRKSYTTSMKLSGQITFDRVLTPNMDRVAVNVASYSLFDGLNTYNETNSYVVGPYGQPDVSTNANGDITSPEKAKFVLDYTGVDGVMIGRAAQGKPWIFREIDHYLKTGKHLDNPSTYEIKNITIAHVKELYDFYGENAGLKIARKHISWYTKGLKNSANFRHHMNTIETIDAQIKTIEDYFNFLSIESPYIKYEEEMLVA